MAKKIWILLVLAMLCGCSAQRDALQEFAPPEEQRLVVYTSHKSSVYQPILREFEERTGIWVEVVSGGTYDVLDKVRQELKDPTADIVFGGGVDSLEGYADCFQPYSSPNSDGIPEAFRDGDDLWVPFSALPVVLVYNTKLVSPDTLTCWQDLSRPEFRGKIAFADPEKSGSCFTALVTYRQIAGDIGLKNLSNWLAGSVLSSSGSILSEVSAGNCLVGITLEEAALREKEAGSSIGLVYPSDGTSVVPDGIAIVKNAPHLDNARRFLDFILSRDVQSLLAPRFRRRSVFPEIQDSDGMSALEELKILPYNSSWAAENRSWILQSWRVYMEEVTP